jgi:hypothetical protein
MALVLVHAIYEDNDHENVPDANQTLYIQATSESHENLVQIYHSYTDLLVKYDNKNGQNYLYCARLEDKILEILLLQKALDVLQSHLFLGCE